MQVHHYRDVELLRADFVGRTSLWTMLVLPAILLAACLGIAWAILTKNLPPFFWVSVAIMGPLVPLITSINVLPSLRATNWVLKQQGDTLYVMLRNFRNRHEVEDGPTVISIPLREVDSVGKHVQRISISSGGRITQWTEKRLEIRLRDEIGEEVRAALDAENRRRPPRKGFVYSKRYYASPVTLDGARTIRILWLGRFDVVRPSVDRTLDHLRPYVTIHGEVAVDRRDVKKLSPGEFDELVLDLCTSGDRVSATKLLVEHRGFSLTDARRFVDGLC